MLFTKADHIFGYVHDRLTATTQCTLAEHTTAYSCIQHGRDSCRVRGLYPTVVRVIKL